MNRKLHNTILAFSVTGVLLFVGVIAASPAHPPAVQAPVVLPLVTVQPPADPGDLDAVVEAAVARRAEAFEAEFARAASPGEALALTAGFIAATATESALTAALAELGMARASQDIAADIEDDDMPPARKSGRARDVIAVPYFSFARGSHRGSRS